MKKLICLILVSLFTFLHGQGITNTLGGNTSADKFVVENSNSYPGLVVTGEGYVGIGSASPLSKLVINSGSSDVSTMFFQNDVTGSTTSDGLMIGYNGCTSDIWNFESCRLRFGTNGTEMMSLNDNNTVAIYGKVGVGLANPSQNLTVYDETQARIALQIDNSGTDSNDGLQIIHGQGTNGQSWIVNNEDHHLHLGTNGSNDITIENGGQVGIQTTAPNANLDVNGDVILGENGTRFMEIVEITGTTSNSSSYYSSYTDKLPTGWTGAKTRLLSLEIKHSSSNNWASIGAATDGSHSIGGWLDDDGRTFWIYYPDETAWKGTAWRAMIMRMP